MQSLFARHKDVFRRVAHAHTHTHRVVSLPFVGTMPYPPHVWRGCEMCMGRHVPWICARLCGARRFEWCDSEQPRHTTPHHTNPLRTTHANTKSDSSALCASFLLPPIQRAARFRFCCIHILRSACTVHGGNLRLSRCLFSTSLFLNFCDRICLDIDVDAVVCTCQKTNGDNRSTSSV